MNFAQIVNTMEIYDEFYTVSNIHQYIYILPETSAIPTQKIKYPNGIVRDAMIKTWSISTDLFFLSLYPFLSLTVPRHQSIMSQVI